MDSKRKPSFSLSANNRTKKIKADHPRKAPCAEPLSFEQGAARSRIHQLRNLVREINDSQESIQCHAFEAGADVMKAVAELDGAFHPSRNLKPPTSRISSAAPETNLSPVPGARDLVNGGRHFLPAIPPILDELLEKAVFTHPGVSDNTKATYDRLEILGDAYIELIATKFVWNRFQELPSGRISQIRELLVKNETLSEYATNYGLDRRASVPHDYLSQPKRWIKTKGDIFEAYVAAVILSNHVDGYGLVEEWLTRLWLPKIEGLGAQKPNMEGKQALAKQIMGKGIKLKYVDEHPAIQLEKGMQKFFIGVYLTGWGWENKHLGSGQGLNKTIAGDEAARQALQNETLINEIIATKKSYEVKKN